MAAPNRAAGYAMQFALGLAAAVMLVDQASKWSVLTFVMNPPRVLEVTGFFNLVLVYNTGVSFGLMGGGGAWMPWALSGFALLVVVALFIWLGRQPEWPLALAVGLVAGGALGNLIDRLHQPGVVDFLDFHLGGWHWPTFNLADSGIFLGVVILVFDGLFCGHHRSKDIDNDNNKRMPREG